MYDDEYEFPEMTPDEKELALEEIYRDDILEAEFHKHEKEADETIENHYGKPKPLPAID
jgi:hypothetical protein